ncbi:replicative DNA helicase [Azorhizobium doebereinerae]|uniref:replicative DNA helicase n=1 Tax=Azorhizobium doebereinerae TaxID=281091 RepID=UPI00048F1138|nr:DnaB-like helicase C-terminal domain-containing protein [Azorhizobium doebereinerae]
MAKRESTLVNIPAEKAVIGAVLRSESAYWQVADLLRADQFYQPIHQQIYGVVRDICEEGKKLSHPLVVSRLPEEDEEGNSLASYLAVLLKNADEVGSPLDFAGDVADMAARRTLVQIADWMSKQARSFDKSPTDIAAEAESGLNDVMHAAAPRRPRRLNDIVHNVLTASNSARDGGSLPGFGTGLLSVDEILGRILPGDLGFILGSQGDGKSALASQIGVHASLSRPVLMFQFEMTDEVQAAREISAASGISVGDLQEGAFDFAQRDSLVVAEQNLKAHDFYIYDQPKQTIRQIRAHCLAMKRTSGLGMVIIDQLDKIKPQGRHKDRFEKMAELTGDLKDLAKDLRVPVVVLAQRTRGAQRRDDPTPHILDADAPSIERDADWVLAVWREESWLRQNRPDQRQGGAKEDEWLAKLRRAANTAKVIVLKRRRGKANEERELAWDGRVTRFREQ